MNHEARVRRFYSHGVENYGRFHENYLNFGYWARGTTDYVRAAEALLERLGDAIALSPDSDVLDVACGMGTQDEFLASRFGCRSIEAVDLTPEHIVIARARHASRAITFRVGDACRLPFVDGAFTHVMAVEGIVHFNTRETFFREALRVLGAGGWLGVTDFFLGRQPRSRVERLLLRWCTAAWHVPADNAVTVAGYRTALERSGFEEIAIEIASDQVIPGYVAEQSRPEVRRQVCAIRGAIAGRAGVAIDRLMYRLYRAGLIGYLIARARKPAQGGSIR